MNFQRTNYRKYTVFNKGVSIWKDLFFYLKITNFVLEALIDNLLALSHFTTLFILYCIIQSFQAQI
jgi:hypothetical protein